MNRVDVLTWWYAGQRTGEDNGTGPTCWQAQPNSWCGDTYPGEGAQANLHESIINLHLWENKSVYNWWTSARTYPCPGHVELDGTDDDKDEQTAEWDLCQRPLCVPWDVLQYLREGERQNWGIKSSGMIIPASASNGRLQWQFPEMSTMCISVYPPPRGWSDWRHRPRWGWAE